MNILAARASAPTRVDLAGGTLDIWPLNLMVEGALTLNMAINVRAHAAVTPLRGGAIAVRSEDQATEARYSSPRALRHDHRLGLITRLIRHLAPEGGVEVVTRSEAPAGAGLAGSSALAVAVCGALARATGVRLAPRELIEIVRDHEAAHLGIPTGLQDYGAAVHGGVHAFHFPAGGMKPEPIRGEALARRVVLFFSGASRSSGINNWEMFRRLIEKDRRITRRFGKIASIAREAAQALRVNNMAAFDRAVNEEWRTRRTLFPAISTPVIDRAIASGRRAGAKAARICGAGGGGCFFLLAEPERHAAVIRAVESHGCRHIPFSLSKSGLKF